MANDQKFLGALVEHAPVEELSAVERQYWIRNGTELGEVLAKALKRNLVAVAVASTLLVLVGTVSVSATTEPFVTKNKFVVNTERNAPVKVSYLGDNFKAWFLSGDGKTEDLIGEQTLRYHKLRQSSVDGPIIAELGGAEKSETTLSEMFSLMEKQGKGEDGVLLNNGLANIFYIRDQKGVLRTVLVSWNDDGWNVRAHSVEDPDDWDAAFQVFSRN